MRPMIPLFAAVTLALAGCQSPFLTHSDTRWPSMRSLGKMGVQSVLYSTEEQDETPFIAPIKDIGDLRFINEANIELAGTDANNNPLFRTPEGIISLVLHLEEPNDELGLPNRKWAEIFTVANTINTQMENGRRVTCDQWGWSIYEMGADLRWRRRDRAAFRRSQWTHPLHRLLRP